MNYFASLPIEVIAKILDYLDFKDMQAAQLTCNKWLWSSEYLGYQNRIVLKLTSLNSAIREIFAKSRRKFPIIHLVVKNNVLENDETIKFFSAHNIFTNLKMLIFERCTVSFGTFNEILKLSKNLEELVCDETNIFFPKMNMNHFHFAEILSTSISDKLKVFSFSTGSNLTSYSGTIKLFCRIKNLQSLHINLSDFETDSLFTIYQIIKNSEKTLTKLSLKLSKEYKPLTKSLYLLHNLHLKEVSLVWFVNQSVADVSLKFLLNQNYIKSLSLESICKLRESDAITILEKSPLLEKLSFENSGKLSFNIIQKISSLNNLKYLNINCVSGIRSNDLVNGLFSKKNTKLVELRCMQLRLKDEAYLQMWRNLPNLMVLHCGSRTLTDAAVQSIIYNCKRLTVLNIFSSDKVTDYGLTGINSKSNEKTGYCIAELKNLQHLNLRKCDKITEETLIHGLKFNNLKVLYLPACFQHFPQLPWVKIRKAPVTGLNALTKNCRSIVQLNLLGCSGHENLDEAIEILLFNLPKLERITIARHCERVIESQEANLVKGRQDLSKIQIRCVCEVCIKIKTLCEDFILGFPIIRH